MLCLLISSGAKLRRRCYKLFAIALQYGYNAARQTAFLLLCSILHGRIVTCYMLHVTLRPPHFHVRLLASRTRSCKRSSQIHVASVARSRIVTCYMLHVTLRLPPLPPPPPREALYLLFSCFPADLCFFYSLAREKSNCSPPPSRLLTRMLPRWRMTAFLTMASPSPVPPSDRLRPLSTR